MLQISKKYLRPPEGSQPKTLSFFSVLFEVGPSVGNTNSSLNILHTINQKITLKQKVIKDNILVSRQFSTCNIVSSSNKSQSKNYRELELDKLINRINKGGKQELKLKPNAATESKVSQTHEGIQKAAAKTLEDMKYFFKFSFKVSIFLLVTLVPISIFCCWYSPTHRAKTSKQSPQWGKVIDLILDEIEDEVKSIKGTPIEQSKNLIKELLLKEEVSSFQDSVDDKFKEKENPSSPETLK